jgi:putative endonuclease
MVATRVLRKPWSVYILRCGDGTLYTGITTDVGRRIEEHNAGKAPGARYTRGRRPVELAYIEDAASRAAASRREATIKRLDRRSKLALCESWRTCLTRQA